MKFGRVDAEAQEVGVMRNVPGGKHSFRGFTLDLHRGVLTSGGRDLELRPKSWALLTYLVENAGRVIPKGELLDAVWPNAVVTEDSLTQCISEIRRTLKDNAGELVRTVPRRGYLFLETALEPSAKPAPQGVVGGDTIDQVSTVPRSFLGGTGIAVLPFNNVGHDPEQSYFCDGVVEEIITALSHFPRLFVIARNSTFTYNGRAVDVREVSRDLGVRYVLEGSVRRSGGRLRISAQLVDGETGAHVWADRFDGVLEDVFDLQDRVTLQVVGALTPRLIASEVERARRKRPENLDAYDFYLRALSTVREMTLEGVTAALANVDRALEADPNYAVAAGLGGWAYTLILSQYWKRDVAADRGRGLELGKLALAHGQNDAEALSMGGYAVAFHGEELHEGLTAIERSIGLNANGASAFAHAGWVRCYLGQPDQAIIDFERSMQLSPRDSMLFRAQSGLAFAHLFRSNFEQAVLWGRRALESNPNYNPTYRALAPALVYLGRLDEAERIVDRMRTALPHLTARAFRDQTLFRYSGQLDMILDGLRRAGLPAG